MPLLPPSTNDQYRGSLIAARFLALLGVLTVVPGCIHTFLPDGGAGVIAGIDLRTCGPLVVALFAWAGATQIAFGAMMLLVALRHRPLVPVTLALVLLERSLHALDGWLLKGGGGHHPPEHYAVLVGVPLLAIALAASLRPGAA
jgi:hypothetical protein